ncbi:MAG: hypothetical protein JNM63_09580 [Spirochaetia bacterium]|nr:hypothetical protein [Spirochaetia bacterium]
MRRKIIFGVSLAIALILSSCTHTMTTPAALDRFFASSKKHGFALQSKPTPNSWVVSFQGAGMKQSWSLIVAISKSPGSLGSDGKRELELVSVGTTVWRGKTEPSKETMSYLLQMNAVDDNVGSLSLFRQDGEWFVQFFTRVPAKYLTEEWLEFAVGFVGGFADATSERMRGMR